MDKRYQVFVSSTYKDLQDERQEVMQALLELDCMPSGMELFPAANDDQWTLIKKVIDDCDYYIVVIGGCYGSLGAEGLSYTEMEYRYALESGKPIIAFLHKDPGALPAKHTEGTQEGKEKLESFREFAQQKMVKFWNTPADLGSVVSRSLVLLIKNNPGIGWVKADLVPDENLTKELLRQKQRIEELETSLISARTQAPDGTEKLAQGDDTFKFEYTCKDGWHNISDNNYTGTLTTTWNNIFSFISPLLINEVRESELKYGLNNFVKNESTEWLSKQKEFKDKKLDSFTINDVDFHTIKIQLRALGLITKSIKPRSVKDTSAYWTLGDSVMTKMRAIKKSD